MGKNPYRDIKGGREFGSILGWLLNQSSVGYGNVKRDALLNTN